MANFNGAVLSTINLTLSLVILALGCWGYRRTKSKTPFYIGAAFGLFSISHLISILQLENKFADTVMLIRVFGYLIIAFTLFKIGHEKNM